MQISIEFIRPKPFLVKVLKKNLSGLQPGKICLSIIKLSMIVAMSPFHNEEESSAIGKKKKNSHLAANPRDFSLELNLFLTDFSFRMRAALHKLSPCLKSPLLRMGESLHQMYNNYRDADLFKSVSKRFCKSGDVMVKHMALIGCEVIVCE